MVLSFVKIDVGATICKMTETYYINYVMHIPPYKHEAIRIPKSENNIGAPLKIL